MSSCTEWMPTRRSAFLTQAMPWPGYTLRSLMTSQPSLCDSASIDEAETQRQHIVDPPMRWRSPSPAVPPGFEASVAARTAVTAAI